MSVRSVSQTVLVLLVLAATNVSVVSSPPALGVFDGHTDVGRVRHAGGVRYDRAAETYGVSGSGTNMWEGYDEFHFVWKRVTGHVILQSRIAFEGVGTDPHRKAGLMIRAGLEAEAIHVNASRHGDGLMSVQLRRTVGGPTEEIKFEGTGQDMLQIERRGATVIVSVARFGETFVSREVADIPVGDSPYVGIFVCSHNADVIERAVFDNVRLIRPVRDGFVPYREYIGSDVELLDVHSGRRRVVHHEADSIQAPNWTPDAKRLILNRNGLIYAFELATRRIRPIPTGTVTRNNNDHALSFDGRMLGLSAGQPSRVYTVPVTGGEPTLITPTGPSYLHSWSPDSKWLVFTGQRDGDFDIYAVPAAGGPERRLTTAPGLDDGPEYTPDGRWIYFISTRTGRMQIWRMKPDGSDQQQLTFDNFNNWFPHISPDGRSITFISYGPEIKPDDHPWYKHVYLRKMSLDGGTPAVIAYVYGGQGSMNVNSWSPDNRTIAFVSNSGTF